VELPAIGYGIRTQTQLVSFADITIFVDDLDAIAAEIAARGIEPAERATYSNGVRKVTYRDEDGNEIGFGGAPVER
jgi:hypothetical protein